MKLATLRDGSRDGQLLVVSRDLRTAHLAQGLATRLQQVLDDWNFLSPQLQDLSEQLNAGKARHAFVFDPAQCMAPLPRAGRWVSGAGRGGRREADQPPTSPVMAQGGSDRFLGPREPAPFASADLQIDSAAGLAVVTGDVPTGCGSDRALDAIRLVLLVNDWTLRAVLADELARGFGLLHSKPATACSPVAVTPDELGAAWRGGHVHLTLQTHVNGRPRGRCNAADVMPFHFGQWIAHAATTRPLGAGSVIGSGGLIGTCAAGPDDAPDAAAPTAFLQFGDAVRIDAEDADGLSVFGAIEQAVVDRNESATASATRD